MKSSMIFAVGVIGSCASVAWAQPDEWKPVASRDGVDVYYRAIDDASRKKEVTTVKVRNNTKKAFDVVIEILLAHRPAKPGELAPPIDLRRKVYLQVKPRSEEIRDVLLDEMIAGQVKLFCMAKVGTKEKCEIPLPKPKQ
jgi:hypothetical protein